MGKKLPTYRGAKRAEDHEDNQQLNELLVELAGLLRPAQDQLLRLKPEMPVACIVGNPRSGSTLLLQWMASLGIFSYPTNLLTRFAYAPYIGARVQQMLFDPAFDCHGDFSDLQSGVSYESDLGKSRGALACNEFQHFFRSYMPNFDLEWLDQKALEAVDCSGILQGLASIERAFGKPFVTKATLLQFNLSFFAEHMLELFWIHIVREPLYVMQSLLAARKKYYGRQDVWFSAKPKEYVWLKDMDVFHQIAGQVYFTEKVIEEGLKTVPESRQLTISYEAFCDDPASIFRNIAEKYVALGSELADEYNGPESFACRNQIRLPEEEICRLQATYDEFVTFNMQRGDAAWCHPPSRQA